MKNKSTILALAVCLIAIAAFARDGGKKTINVETDPPGMRIYFCVASSESKALKEREYIGQSPCEVSAKINADGRFRNTISTFVPGVAAFYAEPPAGATNLFSKQKIIDLPTIFHKSAKAPDKIFFDMTRTNAD